MNCTLKNYYSKYFYILSIFIFIITVGYATEVDDKRSPLEHITNFRIAKWQNFCESFNTVLADVDVLFKGISNVNEAHVNVLKRLERAKKKIIFYTTIIDPTINLNEKLKSLGYTTEFELYNPVSALKWYLDYINFSGKVYVFGDEKLNEMLENLNIATVFPDSITFEQYKTGYNTTLDDDVKAVIIGFDVNRNIIKFHMAQRYLEIPKVQLFVTQRKSTFDFKYFDDPIRKLIKNSKKTEEYIDRLNGIFGDFLVEKNYLEGNKVLHVSSGSFGNHNFTQENRFKPLLIGFKKIKKNVTLPMTYYYVEDFGIMPTCCSDE